MNYLFLDRFAPIAPSKSSLWTVTLKSWNWLRLITLNCCWPVLYAMAMFEEELKMRVEHLRWFLMTHSSLGRRVFGSKS